MTRTTSGTRSRSTSPTARRRVIPESRRDVLSALKIVAEEEVALSRYNDKVVLSVAEREDLALATFDEKLRRQASSRGVKVIP